jgi:hypothetical protein
MRREIKRKSQHRLALGDARGAAFADYFVRTLGSFPSVRMHLVHMYLLTKRPPSNTRTRWMFGLNCRLVLRFEWLTFCPNCGPLPHTSHFAMGMPHEGLFKQAVVMLP